MMTILNDVKTRLQTSQISHNISRAELRRCNTSLKANDDNPSNDPKKKNDEPLISDEKEKLRTELNASYAAQKRLGVMCASLGREKAIISRELTRKVQELNEMEELVSNLRAQNERLSVKIQACVAEYKEGRINGKVSEMVSRNNATLQERSKDLSEQLMRSLEGYKSMKWRVKGHEETERLVSTMEEVGGEIEIGINQLHSLKKHIDACNLGEQMRNTKDIAALDQVFKRLKAKVMRFGKERKQ